MKQRIEKIGWELALAAHIYYHGDGQSFLSDQQYDAAAILCVKHWGKLSSELKALFESKEALSATGFHIRLSAQQLEKAKRITGVSI